GMSGEARSGEGARRAVEIRHLPAARREEEVAALAEPWIADEGACDAGLRRHAGREADGRPLRPRGLAFDERTTVVWDEDGGPGGWGGAGGGWGGRGWCGGGASWCARASRGRRASSASTTCGAARSWAAASPPRRGPMRDPSAYAAEGRGDPLSPEQREEHPY